MKWYSVYLSIAIIFIHDKEQSIESVINLISLLVLYPANIIECKATKIKDKNVSILKLCLPRQKWTMNETLIFFKIRSVLKKYQDWNFIYRD